MYSESLEPEAYIVATVLFVITYGFLVFTSFIPVSVAVFGADVLSVFYALVLALSVSYDVCIVPGGVEAKQAFCFVAHAVMITVCVSVLAISCAAAVKKDDWNAYVAKRNEARARYSRDSVPIGVPVRRNDDSVDGCDC